MNQYLGQSYWPMLYVAHRQMKIALGCQFRSIPNAFCFRSNYMYVITITYTRKYATCFMCVHSLAETMTLLSSKFSSEPTSTWWDVKNTKKYIETNSSSKNKYCTFVRIAHHFDTYSFWWNFFFRSLLDSGIYISIV